MKKLMIGSEWFGPFNEIISTNDSYICDGGIYPYSVVGNEGIISDFDPDVDKIPLSQEQQKILYDSIVVCTQARLDNFAKTRGYDGILSASSYATSQTQKFQIEGQYCLTQRDATWVSLIEMFDEVVAGTRPMPTSYADIEPDLPPLVWPN